MIPDSPSHALHEFVNRDLETREDRQNAHEEILCLCTCDILAVDAAFDGITSILQIVCFELVNFCVAWFWLQSLRAI